MCKQLYRTAPSIWLQRNEWMIWSDFPQHTGESIPRSGRTRAAQVPVTHAALAPIIRLPAYSMMTVGGFVPVRDEKSTPLVEVGTRMKL
jgi:hypothetical protein